MLEEFTSQIVLTPTVSKILKEQAKINRYSARIYLDIILRERFAELIAAKKNEDYDIFN
jgi:hypothetical protein